MTDKLNLNLEYCYGIGKLEAELDFMHKGYAIYAPNGVMKTSFAKTMLDLSQGKEPSDLAFPDRTSVFEVTLNGKPLNPEEIFVVQSSGKNYPSDEVSTLLANTDLKKKYEQIHKNIGAAKKDLDKRLRVLSGFGEKSKENIEAIVEAIFDEQYYDALLGLKGEIDEIEVTDFANADYKILFDSKVNQLFTDPSVGKTVEDFAQKYDELTEISPILRKEFQYHNVTQVQQQLESNNFFAAGHSINLADKNSHEKAEFTSNQSLREKIEAEKLRVLSDEAMKGKFEAFNAKLKNKELQAFRDYITVNQHLLPELRDLDSFKRKLWVQYILSARNEYDALIYNYKIGQAELAAIVAEANANRGDWDEVVADFNRRFLYLPFELFVENKSDVILKGTTPSIGFIFRDGDDEKKYYPAQKDELLRVLSTGEARALYILDIMYVVHTKWKCRKKTLFIFDDVADSFDYKNKFAIVDFLESITKNEEANFLAIILTHNFDFLRTIASRGICQPFQCRLAFKNGGKVKLSNFDRSDIQNPFHKWQRKLSEAIFLIAYIPFLRNVIEYTQGTKNSDNTYNVDYLTLTRMIHYKDETEGLNIADYKEVFEKTFPNVEFPNIDLDVSILSHIFSTADHCQDADDGINLEHKIVLSMATRIWAERYMIGKIRSNDPNYDTSKKQTGELFQSFKDQFNNQTNKIGLLRRVNLITPANIHINAFMYEPILDMGFGELKSLYQEVKIELV